jgi:SNF2 family DNA or RNA helicase
MIETVKVRLGQYRVPLHINHTEDLLYFKFRFNRALIAEVKAMEGARWDPKTKLWRASNSPRNHFQLAYLKGENPFARYDAEIIESDFERSLFYHQEEFVNFMLTRHYCIIAGEMGLGKTLAAIEVMERSGHNSWWFIAPKSALKEVNLQLGHWDSKIKPELMTYEKLVRIMAEWPEGGMAPRGVFFDESVKLKTPGTQRSKAGKMLADGIRQDHGNLGSVILMSGAPAPKSPADWWHQCEVACPGFLKEGNIHKFKRRLAVIVDKESPAGGSFPSIEAWKDDENRCDTCGGFEGEPQHDAALAESMEEEYHPFIKSKNEVAHLYDRMQGLVLVRRKKDCLDLPDMHYKLITLEPAQKTINLARSIVRAASTVISGITLLRELSDGFQYMEEKIGDEECPVCHGSGKQESLISEDLCDVDLRASLVDKTICDGCGGKGTRPRFQRITKQVDCPKEGALVDVLDDHFDIGRLVVYGGFTGSVDRCVEVAKAHQWKVIRVDGRGWNQGDMEGEPLDIFQNQQEKYPHVVFIAQPGAGGMGITLTASPTILYYSNDFDFDHRIQSESRIHRIGMDVNRGATIIDLVHLETDRLILDNLQRKNKLQALTLGEMTAALDKQSDERMV